MSGCFGGSAEDRHFEGRLMNHLDDEHHSICKCNEDHEDYSEDAECTCDEEHEDDYVESKLAMMDI